MLTRSKAADFMDSEDDETNMTPSISTPVLVDDIEEDTFVEDADLSHSTNPEQVTFLEIRESQSQKYDDPEAERTQVITRADSSDDIDDTEDGGVVQEILSDSETESDVAEDTHCPSGACDIPTTQEDAQVNILDNNPRVTEPTESSDSEDHQDLCSVCIRDFSDENGDSIGCDGDCQQ